MKIVAIVQARMSSTRLPGKVLAPIEGRSMLARVCRRAARASRIDDLVVATSSCPQDDPVAAECRSLGLPCFRGSEQDVLDRYYQAAKAHGAEAVVRITADCPLIDPGLIDDVVTAMLEHKPDYASNVLQRTYPRGLDTEIATLDALQRAWQEAAHPYQRVHVMPYFYENPQRFRLHSVTGAEDLSRYRWTVDSPEDLALVRAVYGRLAVGDAFSWREALGLVSIDEALSAINGGVRQKQVVEG